MNARKRAWIRPVLIIIGRGTPEETVLDACKTSRQPIGPETTFCRPLSGNGTCQAQGNS